MDFATPTSPHLHGDNGVRIIMAQVILALVPGTIAMWWFLGWGILVNVILACVTAVISEWLFIKSRGRNPWSAVNDLTAVVTAWLLALALPPLLPWWQTVLGSAFSIIIAKQLFGGIGYNTFNPAMAGYVLLLISFPASMSQWLSLENIYDKKITFGETLNAIFNSTLPKEISWDAITSATPLDAVKTQLTQNQMISEIKSNLIWGEFTVLGWEWISIAFLFGGLFLLWRKVITWRIPFSLLGSLFLISSIFWMIDPELNPSPGFHLLSGAAILGAFFIATDPVSASTTPQGQIIYGALIGLLIYVIRTWGGYPDAVAFGVLLLNMAVSMIDQYTQPKVFGVQRSKSD